MGQEASRYAEGEIAHDISPEHLNDHDHQHKCHHGTPHHKTVVKRRRSSVSSTASAGHQSRLSSVPPSKNGQRVDAPPSESRIKASSGASRSVQESLSLSGATVSAPEGRDQRAAAEEEAKKKRKRKKSKQQKESVIEDESHSSKAQVPPTEPVGESDGVSLVQPPHSDIESHTKHKHRKTELMDPTPVIARPKHERKKSRKGLLESQAQTKSTIRADIQLDAEHTISKVDYTQAVSPSSVDKPPQLKIAEIGRARTSKKEMTDAKKFRIMKESKKRQKWEKKQRKRKSEFLGSVEIIPKDEHLKSYGASSQTPFAVKLREANKPATPQTPIPGSANRRHPRLTGTQRKRRKLWGTEDQVLDAVVPNMKQCDDGVYKSPTLLDSVSCASHQDPTPLQAKRRKKKNKREKHKTLSKRAVDDQDKKPDPRSSGMGSGIAANMIVLEGLGDHMKQDREQAPVKTEGLSIKPKGAFTKGHGVETVPRSSCEKSTSMHCPRLRPPTVATTKDTVKEASDTIRGWNLQAVSGLPSGMIIDDDVSELKNELIANSSFGNLPSDHVLQQSKAAAAKALDLDSVASNDPIPDSEDERLGTANPILAKTTEMAMKIRGSSNTQGVATPEYEQRHSADSDVEDASVDDADVGSGTESEGAMQDRLATTRVASEELGENLHNVTPFRDLRTRSPDQVAKEARGDRDLPAAKSNHQNSNALAIPASVLPDISEASSLAGARNHGSGKKPTSDQEFRSTGILAEEASKIASNADPSGNEPGVKIQHQSSHRTSISVDGNVGNPGSPFTSLQSPNSAQESAKESSQVQHVGMPTDRQYDPWPEFQDHLRRASLAGVLINTPSQSTKSVQQNVQLDAQDGTGDGSSSAVGAVVSSPIPAHFTPQVSSGVKRTSTVVGPCTATSVVSSGPAVEHPGVPAGAVRQGQNSKPWHSSWSFDQYETILAVAAEHLGSMPENWHKDINVERLRVTMDENPTLSQWFTQIEKAGVVFDRARLTQELQKVVPLVETVMTFEPPSIGNEAQPETSLTGSSVQRLPASGTEAEPPIQEDNAPRDLVLNYLAEQLLQHPTKGLLPCLQAYFIQQVCEDVGIPASSNPKCHMQMSNQTNCVADSGSAMPAQEPHHATPHERAPGPALIWETQLVQDVAPTTACEIDDDGAEQKFAKASKNDVLAMHRTLFDANSQGHPCIGDSKTSGSNNSSYVISPMQTAGPEEQPCTAIRRRDQHFSDSDLAMNEATSAPSPASMEKEHAEKQNSPELEESYPSVRNVEDMEAGESFALSKNGVIAIRISVSDSPAEREFLGLAKNEVLKALQRGLDMMASIELEREASQEAENDLLGLARFTPHSESESESLDEFQQSHETQRPSKPNHGNCQRCGDKAKRWYYDDGAEQWICPRCYSKDWRERNRPPCATPSAPDERPEKPSDSGCQCCHKRPQKWYFLTDLQLWTCKKCYDRRRYKMRLVAQDAECVKDGVNTRRKSQKLREALGEGMPEDELLLLTLRDEGKRSWTEIQAVFEERGQLEAIETWKKRHQRLRKRMDT